MPRLTDILSYGQGGLAVAVVAAVLVTSGRVPARVPRGLIVAAAILAALPLVADLLLSGWYLFSPTYIDHIEASVASVTHYFMQGAPVYPDLGSYTFNGLLYGPLLAELNSLGYLVSGGVLGSKLVGWAAAWVAVVVMVFTARRAERGWAWAASLIAPCCVLASFGNVLTADRADSLLLLFATLALWAVVRLPRLAGLLLAALLAGLAADLKLHGPAYIVPALGCWLVRYGDTLIVARRGATAEVAGVGPMRGVTSTAAADGVVVPVRIASTTASAAGIAPVHIATIVAAAALVMALGVALPFLPSNVSLTNYLSYLQLGAKHGLRIDLFAWNLTFLLSLWIPALLVAWAARRQRASLPRHLAQFAVVLGVMEFAVAVIASKPGAGSHHLLPFLGFHAWLVQQLLAADAGRVTMAGRVMATSVAPASDSWRELPAARGVVTGLAAVLLGTAWPAAAMSYSLFNFNRLRPAQEAAFEELRGVADRFPHGMMGIAGPESYALTIFRPWLTLRGTPQTDYGAWMDWQLSGMSDAPLAKALRACEIPYVFIPSGGEPFTMDNNYDSEPLFSDDVRAAFASNYSLIQPGQYYFVYGCAAEPSIKRESP
jgi:hypothetical protein